MKIWKIIGLSNKTSVTHFFGWHLFSLANVQSLATWVNKTLLPIIATNDKHKHLFNTVP